MSDHTIADEIRDKNLDELITAVDPESGNPSHPIEKLDAHIHNVPHLAISIFIFDGDQMLLQQRALTKYHAGGLWANSVCSHPRWQETPEDCAQRRMREELGWNVPLKEFGRIQYAAQVGELYENERVHCFIGKYDKQINHDIDVNGFDRAEVSAIEWLSVSQIVRQIDQRPETFTPWFKIYMAEHFAMINDLHTTV